MNGYKAEISIIIPVFNAGKDLARCIDSILAQTYSNYEVIVVNDGSTDESGQLCDEYARLDKRVRVIHIMNSGVSVARNKGIDLAKGKWVMFIDADDWIYPNTLQTVIDVQKRKEYDTVCINAVKAIDDSLERMKAFSVEDYVVDENESNEIVEALYYVRNDKKHFGDMLRAVWGKLLLLDIIKMNNIQFPIGMPLGEDAAFLSSYFQYSKKNYFLNEYLYVYKISEESAVGKYRSNMHELQRLEYEFIKKNLGTYKKINYNNVLFNFIIECDRQMIRNIRKKKCTVYRMVKEYHGYAINRNYKEVDKYSLKNIKVKKKHMPLCLAIKYKLSALSTLLGMFL